MGQHEPAAGSRKDRIAALGFEYASQPKRNVALCNLCGGGVFTTITHFDRYGFPARASCCQNCGLVFLNPVMTAVGYGQFYMSMYRPLVSAYHGRLIDARTIQTEQREYAAERIEFLAPTLSQSKLGTLLDIGGSTGVVAHHFARHLGLTATVVDPAPLEIEQARRLGLEAITGLIEECDLGGRRFGLVTMCQTVDHLLDISGTLAKIRSVLADNGFFFVDIVDFRAAFLREGRVEGAVKIDHPYYLTEPTMEAYLARFGFPVVAKDYALDHLHISYLCRAGEPDPVYVPQQTETKEMLREIRWVQNRMGGQR